MKPNGRGHDTGGDITARLYVITPLLCVRLDDGFVDPRAAFSLSYFFFFKQKPAYEIRPRDWSSDVCSSDLDDPETHFAEFALLEALGHRHSSITLSLEMFERDVQQSLTPYLNGSLSESESLAQSRPWERSVTDYRPMVQLARARGWPVVAANAPRPMASAVSRAGMKTLDTVSAASRAFAAREMVCPHN